MIFSFVYKTEIFVTDFDGYPTNSDPSGFATLRPGFIG